MTTDNMVDVFESSVREHGDREAIGTWHAGRWVWTRYRELKILVDEARGGLAALGVGHGDRVALISGNRLEWVMVFYAAMGLGAVIVPMYESQRPVDWRFMLEEAKVRVAFTSTRRIFDEVRRMAPELPELKRVFAFDITEGEGSFEPLLQRVEPVAPRGAGPDMLAEIIYTSGTTGTPKGVLLTHGNLAAEVNAMAEFFPLDPSERTLAFLPWAHVLGQVGELHHAVVCGGSAALCQDPKHLLDGLKEVKPSLMVVVPAVFNRIYQSVQQQIAGKPAAIQKLFRDGVAAARKKSHGEKVSAFRELELLLDDRLIFSKIRDKLGGHLKWVFSGGAPLDPDVAELIDALGIAVHEGYGLTETSCAICLQPKEARKIGTVGKPLPGVRIELDTSATGDPRVGEIVVYGPMVTQGYYKRPEENAKAFTRDGGFRTGDLGYFDEDGHLVITGRLKEIYKLENGKYVMPARLEEKLKLSPFIAQAMIHGEGRAYNVALLVPDRAALDAFAAREGRALDDGAVHELLEGEVRRLLAEFPTYEIPKRLLLIEEELTIENGMLTPTMKVRRRDVVARFKDRLDALYARGAPAVE